MSRLSGKTVLITGAASGIGAASVKRFLEDGANVVAVDIDLTKVEASIAAHPVDRTVALAGDTSKKLDAAAAVRAAVERFGALDVLVNNAGIHVAGDITETDEADWDRIIAVNVTGYFNMAKAALPELKKSRGCIVQTSSVSGLRADWRMMAYNTTKGAITNMTRAMAIDHGKDGVRVNAVNPTFTDTGMTHDMQDEATLTKVIERIPMKRIGQPDDIAKAMVFLASDEAGFITGVNLPVDGGLTASNGQPAL